MGFSFWLESHPVGKPQTSGGKQAIYEPDGDDQDNESECLKMDGDYFFAENGSGANISWCEY